MVERANRILIQILTKSAHHGRKNWQEVLELAVFAIKTMKRQKLNVLTYELVYRKSPPHLAARVGGLSSSLARLGEIERNNLLREIKEQKENSRANEEKDQHKRFTFRDIPNRIEAKYEPKLLGPNIVSTVFSNRNLRLKGSS